MREHLPILLVLLPLLCAPLCVLLRHPLAAYLVASLSAALTLLIASCLLFQVMHTGPISYTLSGWIAPWGIEYRLDQINTFVSIFITGIGTVILCCTYQHTKQTIPANRIRLFYATLLLNLTGLLGIIMTGDIFNLFVFIEIASLSSYTLVSLGQDRRSLRAAYEYLIMGTIGASFILIAVGLLYVTTGSLNMVDIHARLPNVTQTNTVKTALAFFVIGIALKCAIFPLHTWLPAAYTYAPPLVAALLSGTTTKVFIYVLIRFIYSVFGADYVFNQMQMDHLFMLFAIASILYGSLKAMKQDELRNMLAWSSIAQIGYMVLAISLNSVMGLAATLIHMFNHAVIKVSLFLCCTSIQSRFGTNTISALRGSGRHMPWVMLVFIVSAGSLVGLPLTAGFVSKWFLIQAAIEQDRWGIVYIIVLASLAALGYTWYAIEMICLKRKDTDTVRPSQKTGWMLGMALLIALLANLFFGINTALTAKLAKPAAHFLLTPDHD